MLARTFALGHLDLVYCDFAEIIVSLAILLCNTFYSSQTQAHSEPWLVLDEPTWLNVRAEAFGTQGPIENPSDSPPNTADKPDGSISAPWSDEELGKSDTSSPPCESNPDDSGRTSPSDDTGDCDWGDSLFRRPSSSLGFREEDEDEFTDTALAYAPCVDVDLEIGLVKSVAEPSVTLPLISGKPSENYISSEELSRLLRLRPLLDSSTEKGTSIHHQPCRRGGLVPIKEGEEPGLFEEESEQGTSENFDSCEELEDGLVEPYSCEGEEVLRAIKRWLLLPSDLEPLSVLYRLSALKDTLAFLPDWIPTKTNLVRDERFMNLRSRADLRHGNALFLTRLRELRWEDLLSQGGKADRDWIQGFLLALESPQAPLIKRRARPRIPGIKSSLCNVTTAEYHLEAEENLASSRMPGGYDAQAKDQRLRHGFQRISERVRRLEDITWEIICEAEDLEMRACFLDVRLEFLDAEIEAALEEEEAAFGSWLARHQALKVQL